MTSHRLVIAEKPSVAASIAAALGVKEKKDGYIEGGGYLISWCVGHLVELADAAAYGEQYKKWSYESLPILPEEWQYTVAADKGKQFKILKELMHRADVSEVVNACDAGREGELIFRFVYGVAKCNKPMRRLWISSMEDSAIRSGFVGFLDILFKLRRCPFFLGELQPGSAGAAFGFCLCFPCRLFAGVPGMRPVDMF